MTAGVISAMPWSLAGPAGIRASAAAYSPSTIARAFARSASVPKPGKTPTSTSRAAAAMAAAGAEAGCAGPSER